MDVTTAREPVVHDHNCHNRRDEAQVRAEEGEEVLGAVYQEPWDNGPAQEMAQNHAADDGEVFGEEPIQIAPNRDGVARDVRDNGRETLDERSQEDECASSWTPVLIENEAVEVPQVPVRDAEML